MEDMEVVTRNENPFLKITTDEIPLILKEMLRDGTFDDKDARRIIALHETTDFKPYTVLEGNQLDACSTAAEKLLFMLEKGLISADEAKQLMGMYFGGLDNSRNGKHNPELPIVPERSSIIIFQNTSKSRRRIKLALDYNPPLK